MKCKVCKDGYTLTSRGQCCQIGHSEVIVAGNSFCESTDTLAASCENFNFKTSKCE